jgi:hypothetical protein
MKMLWAEKRTIACKSFWGTDPYFVSPDLAPHARFVTPQCGTLIPGKDLQYRRIDFLPTILRYGFSSFAIQILRFEMLLSKLFLPQTLVADLLTRCADAFVGRNLLPQASNQLTEAVESSQNTLFIAVGALIKLLFKSNLFKDAISSLGELSCSKGCE